MQEAEAKTKTYAPYFPVVTPHLFRPKSKKSYRRTRKLANFLISYRHSSKNNFNSFWMPSSKSPKKLQRNI